MYVISIKEMEQVNTEFRCPTCKNKLKEALLYLPTKVRQKHPKTVTSTQCDKCRIHTKIDYRVYKRRDGTPRVKIHSIIANEQKYNKKFKILGWV